MSRPAIQALAEQQRIIEAQRATISQQAQQLDGLTRWAKVQHESTQQLARGLQALAVMARVPDQVAAAMLNKHADVQNPAQPVPEPPAVPATQSTQDAKTPEAFADVQAPGLVPGSTNDVAADATSTVYTPGQDVPVSPFRNLVDVTAPIDGTQSPRPLGEVRTETDVRVGDAMNPNVAFPLQGPFGNAQRTSSLQEAGDERAERMVASQRLARLQIQAGLAVGEEDDLVLGTSIEKDASRTLASINQEIGTLSDVMRVTARKQQPQANQRLVPRTAGQRTRPSMQGSSQGRTASVAVPGGLMDNDDCLDI